MLKKISRRHLGAILGGLGVLLIGVGLAVIIPPVAGVIQRSNADKQALNEWKDPGSALNAKLPKDKVVAKPSSSVVATTPVCGSGVEASSYALIEFPQLPGLEGVAGNGNWSMLLERSVVHYASSPAPGGAGNVLFALHREPNFEPLGTLTAGDTIVVENRACQQFTYTITNIWTEYPGAVTQLAPISSGNFITVITCTPLWLDYERLVIRGKLTTS